MQESPHEREGVDNAKRLPFRFLTGLVGLVACLWSSAELVATLFFLLRADQFVSFGLVFILSWVAPPVGWGGLVYACWIRSGRITDTALAFVLSVGVCGMAICFLSLNARHSIPSNRILMAIVYLTGMWIMNGLGIVWIVHKVRRIRAASNTDTADAPR